MSTYCPTHDIYDCPFAHLGTADRAAVVMPRHSTCEVRCETDGEDGTTLTYSAASDGDCIGLGSARVLALGADQSALSDAFRAHYGDTADVLTVAVRSGYRLCVARGVTTSLALSLWVGDALAFTVETDKPVAVWRIDGNN